MAAASIQERLDQVEREMRLIKSALPKAGKKQQPWWEILAGKFKDDAIFDEIVKAGQKYRRQSGRRAR